MIKVPMIKIPKIQKQTGVKLFTLSLVAGLSGCGVFWGDQAYFRNREGDYQKAAKIEPMKVPEGMSDERMGELYTIPPIVESDFENAANEGNTDVPRPQPLATNALQEKVKIQRLGEERWMLMNVAPGEVWPRVRSFLNENGVDVASADISRGVIESHWLQFKSDLNSSDRYRVQIDQGVQPDTSEIHVLHQSLPGTVDAETNPAWPMRSSSAEREAWLLDELAANLARDETLGGTSLLAQAIGGEAKSALVIEKNEPVMKIKLNEERTRATLYHTIRQEGFGIYDSDAERGVYYLHYEKIEEDEGWFSGLFSSDKKLVLKSPYSLEQLLAGIPSGEAFDKAPLSNRKAEKSLPDAPGYLLYRTGSPDDYTVRLRDPYGKRLDAKEARELLTLLRKNLI